MRFQAKVLKVGFDIVYGFKGRLCASEMRVGSEGTQVGGDGGVGGRREEYLLEKKDFFGISRWVMESVETYNKEENEGYKSTERRWL